MSSIMASIKIIILTLFFSRGSLGHALRQSPIVGIAGGHTVNITEAPFTAALLRVGSYKIDGEVWCGGSIIHKQFVLTSAFCGKLDLIVRVGSSRYDEGGKLHQIEKSITHELYSQVTRQNNVALLKLSEPVSFGPSVAAIKLVNERVIPVGLTANVTGWGNTLDRWDASRDLRQVSVRVSPLDDCIEFFGRSGSGLTVTDEQICVNNTRKGACFDDYGAPLTAGDLQIGIVSYGARCWGQPTVYEPVAKHLLWINDHIKQNL